MSSRLTQFIHKTLGPSTVLLTSSILITSSLANAETAQKARAAVAAAFKQNCVTCHTGSRQKTEHFPNGLSFESLASPSVSFAKVGRLVDLATYTQKEVTEGSMPPSGQIDAKQKALLLDWAKKYADPHAVVRDQSESDELPIPSLRRLTAYEYPRVIHDLFHQDFKLDTILPPDPIDSGFDNDAAVLNLYVQTLSPVYVKAGIEILSKADLHAAGLTDCATPEDTNTCTAEVIRRFGRLAFRRPLTDVEVARYLAAGHKSIESGRVPGAGSGASQSSITTALIRASLVNVIASPKFIYRKESEVLTAYELASRLSFLIWSSSPDEALLQAAEDQSLLKPEVMTAQMQRMFDDPRASAFFDNFGEQWLGIQTLTSHIPDASVFPGLPRTLQSDMQSQARLFMQTVFKDKMGIKRLLDADFTWLNPSLSHHYSIPLSSSVSSSGFTRVTLASDSPYRGLLGLGAYLTATSDLGRTSPTRRGNSILDRLACDPVGAPPPDVPKLPAAAKKSNDVRAMLEAHAKDPVCASCHKKMDPAGLTLQNFNAVGQWMPGLGKAPLNDAGKFKDEKVNGVSGLRDALAKPSSGFEACFTKKMMSYAVGHSLRPREEKEAETIAAASSNSETSWFDLLNKILESRSFRRIK